MAQVLFSTVSIKLQPNSCHVMTGVLIWGDDCISCLGLKMVSGMRCEGPPLTLTDFESFTTDTVTSFGLVFTSCCDSCKLHPLVTS